MMFDSALVLTCFLSAATRVIRGQALGLPRIARTNADGKKMMLRMSWFYSLSYLRHPRYPR